MLDDDWEWGGFSEGGVDEYSLAKCGVKLTCRISLSKNFAFDKKLAICVFNFICKENYVNFRFLLLRSSVMCLRVITL